MRNFQPLRNIPGNANLATSAFLPLLGDGLIRLGFPRLKGDSVDLIALID
jgi:hypothetical protein